MKIALVTLLCTVGIAHADDKELDKGSVIYARGSVLYRSDAKGKGEIELAPIAAKSTVRALRTDAKGSVLLADVGGKWWWMPLDGSKSLVELPCGEGPAHLDPDGASVLCRSATAPTKSLVVDLATGKQQTLDLPPLATQIVGSGKTRRIVSADKSGIWSAPIGDPRQRSLLAPEAPLRGFVPSPDGTRAVGIYNDYEFDGKKKQPVDVLMGFALDGQGARRKGIRDAVPLDWSFDNQYTLVQEGAAACLMRANGGQYKCWKGFTAVSVAPDGSYALVIGNRDGSKTPPKTPAKAPAKTPAKKPDPAKGKPLPDDEPRADAPAVDDVPVAPPSGPLALYRAKLDGPYDTAPILVVKIVDGAAVWIPGK